MVRDLCEAAIASYGPAELKKNVRVTIYMYVYKFGIYCWYLKG